MINQERGSAIARDEARWAQLDARIAEDKGRRREVRTAEVIPLQALFESAAPEGGALVAQRLPDWTTLLDTIAAAKTALVEQEARLREYAVQQDILRQDLDHARSETAAYRNLVQEQRAQAKAEAQELQAQADARVRAIQSQAHQQMGDAEERVRSANQRADAAEGWLKRIEEAARDLLPDVQAQPTEQPEARSIEF